MYERYIKRFLDLFASALGLLLLSPLMLLLSAVGAVVMGGNPFFVQERPGKNEKIFKLVKFRTMNSKTDDSGALLPDEERLTAYGRLLRKTSLDEIPELVNIVKGDMSIVGPRPLLVKYLPRYNERQRHRHDVLPGLTGNAQAHGRNGISWEEKFDYDLEYVENVSFKNDLEIIKNTIKSVISQEGISSETSDTMEEFFGTAAEISE